MSTSKSLRNHLKVLEERHRELDKKVAEDYEHYLNDDQLNAEKLEKLKLKHEIADLIEQIKDKEQEEK
jgi:hypothetical protein